MAIGSNPFDTKANPIADPAASERVPELPMDLVLIGKPDEDGRTVRRYNEIIDDRLRVQQEPVAVLQVRSKSRQDLFHRFEYEIVDRLAKDFLELPIATVAKDSRLHGRDDINRSVRFHSDSTT